MKILTKKIKYTDSNNRKNVSVHFLSLTGPSKSSESGNFFTLLYRGENEFFVEFRNGFIQQHFTLTDVENSFISKE